MVKGGYEMAKNIKLTKIARKGAQESNVKVSRSRCVKSWVVKRIKRKKLDTIISKEHIYYKFCTREKRDRQQAPYLSIRFLVVSAGYGRHILKEHSIF